MINPFEVIETIKMVDEENLDIRTITMGISLKSCAGPDVDTVCEKVYEKITTYAKDLVKTGEDIEAQFGIPIINKRISVTPIATLVDALEEPTVEKCVKIAKTLDKAAKRTGVNFIGGYTALVHKDYTNGERILIESIPEALAATDLVCSSVNVGSTRAGINMDAVKQMGQIVKRAAELTANTQGFACTYLENCWKQFIHTFCVTNLEQGFTEKLIYLGHGGCESLDLVPLFCLEPAFPCCREDLDAGS